MAINAQLFQKCLVYKVLNFPLVGMTSENLVARSEKNMLNKN